MRTSARYAGAAAALAAVLLVGGCGSGGGESGDPEPKETARETAEPTQDAGDSPSKGGVEGTWSTKNGADALVLSISNGQAALLGETACSGPVDTGADPVTFTLKCTDGSTDRTEGTVKSVDGESLTVAWKSGSTDTFTKVEVPTEIPTDIGDLPTDLGDLAEE
ncbi:hypothetical protein GCM10010420_43640 [Streptomyces glaucosporus]|uniref:Lipoprotein n=1 Tax=Streptomyces glaucosporus TaxID=284044 RepID=A0ABP5VU49_9ACTN